MKSLCALGVVLVAFGCASSTTDPTVVVSGDASRTDTAVLGDSGSDTRAATDTSMPAEDTGEPAIDTGAAETSAPCDATVCGGACVDLSSDPANCGACGKSCGAGTCVSGSCVCTSGSFSCSGACVDLLTDPANCGSCGKTCATGEICRLASCEKTCTAPTTKCFDECVDITTSAANCGGCGRACAAGESCVASACVCGTKTCGMFETCVAGSCSCTKTTCGTTCTDTATDALNCGTCGNACATGVACIGGTCVSSTTVTFPQTTSTTYKSGGTSPLGSGGGGVHFVTGDYVEDSYTRTAPVGRLDLDIRMYDGTTTSCPVGTLSWAVKINGVTVGSYSFVGGSSGTDKTITQSYTFAPITPSSGMVTIRLEATTTVCSGGSSWNWYPGGTATLY